MIIAFVFILGLFVGSFLNVVILRLHRQESFVSGYSKCLFCQHRLYPKDLVPLFSYLFLKGRCRYCHKKFSYQYPLLEFFTALSFVLIFLKVYPNADFQVFSIWPIILLVGWWTMVAFLIIIFVYDLKYYLILDKVVWPIALLTAVWHLILGTSALNFLLAAIIGGGFFLLQFIISKGKWIGGGDIRLGVLMGIILSWPHILTALFISYILGSIFSIFLILTKRKEWSDKIPFGTFLTLGTFITMMWGPYLVRWYFSLFY